MFRCLDYLLVDDPNDAFRAGWNGEGAHVPVIFPAAHLYVPGVDETHRPLFLLVDHGSDMPHHQLSITSILVNPHLHHLYIDPFLDLKLRVRYLGNERVGSSKSIQETDDGDLVLDVRVGAFVDHVQLHGIPIIYW